MDWVEKKNWDVSSECHIRWKIQGNMEAEELKQEGLYLGCIWVGVA